MLYSARLNVQVVLSKLTMGYLTLSESRVVFMFESMCERTSPLEIPVFNCRISKGCVSFIFFDLACN